MISLIGGQSITLVERQRLSLGLSKRSILHGSTSSHTLDPGQRFLITKAFHTVTPTFLAVWNTSITLEAALFARPASSHFWRALQTHQSQIDIGPGR